MKLYNSFKDKSENTISLEGKQVEELSHEIKKLVLSTKKDKVIEWLKKAANVSENELKDYEGYVE